VKFNKPPLPITDLIAKLEGRGLLIADKSSAEHYLKFIGYYRLSAYCLPFQVPKRALKTFVFERESG
jgi:abortive infection bacteriophage resistance protein